jgi:hypothetical protein
MTRRVERQASGLHEVMDRLDVDGAALVRADQGEVYAQARNGCLSCGTSDKCLQWIDGPPQPGSRPDFCPNLSLFEAFKRVGRFTLDN